MRRSREVDRPSTAIEDVPVAGAVVPEWLPIDVKVSDPLVAS